MHSICSWESSNFAVDLIKFMDLYILSCVFASLLDQKGKFDELVEDNGVRILIEPSALMHVIGTTMDYVEDRLK